MTPQLIADLDRFRQRALVIGGAGLLLSAVGWVANPAQFYRSYLVGFVFWNGLALGCMAIAFLHQLLPVRVCKQCNARFTCTMHAAYMDP